ncbi:MAG: phosphatidylserine decarboxylase family protein [Planctomycetes bacterium]|nr:phosphatidylserine decarboxylase family protein [Planctomycetota bacterium]
MATIETATASSSPSLGLTRYGLAEVICFSLIFLGLTLVFALLGALVHGAFWWGLLPVGILWCFVLSFFRDPQRQVPADPDVLVSPADGTITFLGEVDDPDFPGGRAFRISIFLSIFNVHVNRIPRPGRVMGLRYLPGSFLDARSPDCPARNEQMWIDLEEEATGRLIRVKQIAGAIARRIVCRLKVGDAVKAGERFGMIKFGSRTDVLLPAGTAGEVLVRVGDQVKGGATVLLRANGPLASGAA